MHVGGRKLANEGGHRVSLLHGDGGVLLIHRELLNKVDVLASSEPQLGEVKGALCHEALDISGAHSAEQLTMVVNDRQAADILLLQQGEGLNHVVRAGDRHHVVLALLPVGVPGVLCSTKQEDKKMRERERPREAHQ